MLANARGCVTAFTYDGLDRLTGKSTAGATGCGQGPVSYGYDQAGYGESLGRRTTMTDASGTTTWSYDVRGRVTHEAKTLQGQPTLHTYTTYDALDRVGNVLRVDEQRLVTFADSFNSKNTAAWVYNSYQTVQALKGAATSST